ncbi:hypothetical protein P9112_004337 [Eukaryota sp. TZLM1-RC]
MYTRPSSQTSSTSTTRLAYSMPSLSSECGLLRNIKNYFETVQERQSQQISRELQQLKQTELEKLRKAREELRTSMHSRMSQNRDFDNTISSLHQQSLKVRHDAVKEDRRIRRKLLNQKLQQKVKQKQKQARAFQCSIAEFEANLSRFT